MLDGGVAADIVRLNELSIDPYPSSICNVTVYVPAVPVAGVIATVFPLIVIPESSGDIEFIVTSSVYPASGSYTLTV